jgi:hypothetical protein
MNIGLTSGLCGVVLMVALAAFPARAGRWTGVRPTTTFGPSCIQIADARLGVDANRLSEAKP